jgi:hypothetical protein
MNYSYKIPYALWNVTTEGDCEGKTIKKLGKWEGFIDEIALYLEPEAFYKLEFTYVASVATEELIRHKQRSSSVHVCLDINSGTWDKLPQDISEVKEIFKDRPVEIIPSNYYASFKIISKKEISSEEIKEKKSNEIRIKEAANSIEIYKKRIVELEKEIFEIKKSMKIK